MIPDAFWIGFAAASLIFAASRLWSLPKPEDFPVSGIDPLIGCNVLVMDDQPNDPIRRRGVVTQVTKEGRLICGGADGDIGFGVDLDDPTLQRLNRLTFIQW